MRIGTLVLILGLFSLCGSKNQLSNSNCTYKLQNSSIGSELDPIPFNCTSGFYHTISDGRITVMHKYTVSDIDIEAEVIATLDFPVNATGYNPIDNFIYTIKTGTSELIRIHADGTFAILGHVDVGDTPLVADFTDEGDFYIRDTDDNSLVHILDVNTLEVKNVYLSDRFNPQDWAYSVTEKRFYGVDLKELYMYDIITGEVSCKGLRSIDSDVYAAAFITTEGNLYVAGYENRILYEIDLTTSSAEDLAITPTGVNVFQSDGASCPNAPSPFLPSIISINDEVCVQIDSVASISIFENDLANLTEIDLTTFEIISSPEYGNADLNVTTKVLNYSTTKFLNDTLVYKICGLDTLHTVCDSATVVFSVPSFYESSQTICDGEMVSFAGENYSEEGTYQNIIQNTGGCDSLIILNLVVEQPDTITIETTICKGDSYEFGGEFYSSAGKYKYTLPQNEGCDSFMILDLIVEQPDTITIETMICEGDNYEFGGEFYSSTGEYNYTLPRNEGCDSIVSLNLIIDQQDSTITQEIICIGQSFTFGGEDYEEEGIYQYYQTNDVGCDNLMILDLIIESDGCLEIYAPNIFWPGGENENSRFTLFAKDPSIVQIIELKIYDRWGELIWINENFIPNDMESGWDGQFNGVPLDPAVLVWTAVVEFHETEQEILRGGLTLIR